MVLVGADDGRTAEIVKGLTTKDEVVFEHPANMTAGSAVQVVAKVDWKQQHAEETADRDGQRQTAGQHDHEGGTKR